MEKILSPLTNENNISFVRKINTNHIIDAYKAFGLDVSKYFKDIDSIGIYKCNDTGYKFYYPYNISGDSLFYEHFQQFDWYYMPWKWEHEITLQYISENLNVLEVGCAHGAFIKKINELLPLNNSVGLELNQSAVSKGEKWEIRNQTIESFSNSNTKEFDVVCSFQVLEHISNIHSFLEAQIKCLRTGGILIISVPNNKSFIKENDACLNMPPHHMGLWDNDSLEALTTIFPLKVINVHYEELKEYHVLGYVESIYYSRYSKWTKKMLRTFHKFSGLYQKRINDVTANRMDLLGHTVLVAYEKIIR